MTARTGGLGFAECADLISGQKYGAALQGFKQSVNKLLEAKSFPKRSEVGLQLLGIATALEETLKVAYGDSWDAHVPKFAEEGGKTCSFCGKGQEEVRKLIAGPTVFICDECVGLCDRILAKEKVGDGKDKNKSPSSVATEGLCGICMEPREQDELVFLPHAAYLCAGCLEEIQTVRDRQTGK